ncbi:hypothetical protein KKI23_03865 [Patescibacteria group bacterium]|nr:hypothetical protein [Patescibacteria group bacterium]
MVEIEKIGEESWQDFDAKLISQVPHAAGLIELADIKREVIYLDGGPDLNKKLFELLETYNPCLDDVKHFRVEINPNVDESYLKSFKKYKEENDNKIPRCNRSDPTRKLR